ncbi:MAG: DUF6932 family protein [Gemmataceae bacterium]
MPLNFDARRLLPEGVHDTTLEEVEAALSLSNRRRTLFDGLKQYLAAVRMTGWECQVLLDGSFVMPSVGEPNDIDLILVLPPDWDLTRRDFKPYEYNVLDRGHTKRVLKIEVYPVLHDSERFRYFFDLFTQIRVEWCRQFSLPEDARKGIVRLTP